MMNKADQINPSDAYKALNNGALLIDVRNPSEIANCTYDVKNKKHIPLDQVVSKMGSIKKDQKIIFACASGARSNSATSYFKQNGYKDVHNLRGGMKRWRRENLPVKLG